MVNPYEATNADSSRQSPRAVRRYLTLCSLLLTVALMVAYPGLELLNQEWQIISTRTTTYDVEINGESVSNATAILYTVGTGLVLLLVGLVLGARSFINWRHNRKICEDGARSLTATQCEFGA